jgi:predicted ferric reductase
MKKALSWSVFGVVLLYPLLTWAASQPPGMTWVLALYGFGQVLALTGFILIFFQYILSARIKWIERGLGLDKLLYSHRNLGILGLALVFLHPVALTLFDLIQGSGVVRSPLRAIGVGALVIMLVASLFALIHRGVGMKYETWKTIHRIGYAIFPLAMIHSFFLGSTVRMHGHLTVFWLALAALFAAVFVYRAAVWLRIRGRPFKILGIVQETHDTWSLHLEKSNLSYLPGQFLIIRFRRNGRLSEPHPFTISSSPTGGTLSITVKSAGDFTSTIGATKTTDTAYIDAPYGVFSFLHHRDSRSLVFIAGGIGITPFMSMLRFISDNRTERIVTLLWGNKSEKDVVFRKELDRFESSMPSFKIVHVMSNQSDWQGEKGYIGEEIIRRHVENIAGSRFFLCGPPVMMRKIGVALRSIGVPRRRIHYERFAL